MTANRPIPPCAPVSHIRFLVPYVITMRPYLMFVSGITGITALAFVPTISPGKASLIALASFLAYGFGQALTDCFQTDTDSLSAPYRPLTRGILSTRQVLAFSIAGLIGCILILAFFHPANFLFGVAGGIGLATYTPFKRRWWGGPFYNSLIVVVLFLMAFLAGGSGTDIHWPDGFLLTTGVVFFSYANFVLSGYFKDVDADQCTGYNTLPVAFGRKLSAYASDAIALMTLFFLFLIIVSVKQAILFWPLGFIIVGILMLLMGQVRLHYAWSDAGAHRAIAPILHSYLLLLSGIALLRKPDWGLPLALFYAGFLLALYYRPSEQQI